MFKPSCAAHTYMLTRGDLKRRRLAWTQPPSTAMVQQTQDELITALREVNNTQKQVIETLQSALDSQLAAFVTMQTAIAALDNANATLVTDNAALHAGVAAAAAAHIVSLADANDTIDCVTSELDDALMRVQTLEAESEPTDSDSDSDDDADVFI